MLDKISGRIFVRVIQCDADIDNPHMVSGWVTVTGRSSMLCLLSVKDHNTGEKPYWTTLVSVQSKSLFNLFPPSSAIISLFWHKWCHHISKLPNFVQSWSLYTDINLFNQPTWWFSTVQYGFENLIVNMFLKHLNDISWG